MSRIHAGFCCLLPVILSGAGCSWSRFDDVSEDPPVVALKKPGALEAGFGVGLATINKDESVQLLSVGVSPASRAAMFELGPGESPVIDAVDAGYCASEDGDVCASVSTPVGLAHARGPDDDYDLCFVSGIGATGSSHGLVVRCAGSTQFELPVPDEVDSEIIEPILDGYPVGDVVFLAADRAEAPAVVAGVPDVQMAFFYPPLSRTPIQLTPGGDDRDETFGKTVAVLRAGDQRVFAVGAPEQGHVWLFRTAEVDDEVRAMPLGCLGGISGLGRTLASGRVDDDDVDDLAIADDTNVTVLSGAVLEDLPETDSSACSFASLPKGSLLGSFGCGSTKGVEGCSASQFGAALAVGDLDGDGDGEVIVGAPRMTVRGESNAGALIVFDVEGDHPEEFSEVIFASSIEQDDHLGSSLATPEVEGRHIVAAGAPQGAKTFLFYCPQMLPSDLRQGSLRCH